jgi:FkbM family methyltransferase
MSFHYTEELITNRLGRRFWIYKDDSFYHQRVANRLPYQKRNLLRLRQLVPNPRVVLDVGMNIGMNTIEYATWAKVVHGFEPTPQTYDMALRNIQLAKQQTEFPLGWWPDETEPGGWASSVVSGDITAHNIGLGDTPGSFDILIKKNNAGHNHIDNINIPRRDGRSRSRNTEPEKATIQINTIDLMGFTDVDIIKVDTEGYEFPVIKGAEHTIVNQMPVVQLEMVEGQPERYGYTCQDIYDWFLARDFAITLRDGTDMGTEWVHVPKMMERFFVHRSRPPAAPMPSPNRKIKR